MPFKRCLHECEPAPAVAASKRLSSCLDQLQLSTASGISESGEDVAEAWLLHETPPPSPQSPSHHPSSPQSPSHPPPSPQSPSHPPLLPHPPLPPPAHRHSRLNVLHSTVAKLGQHRTQCDPRLHQSVLLYNTVRLIERQLSAEGVTLAAALHPQHLVPATVDEPVAASPLSSCLSQPLSVSAAAHSAAASLAGCHDNQEQQDVDDEGDCDQSVAMETDECQLRLECSSFSVTVSSSLSPSIPPSSPPAAASDPSSPSSISSSAAAHSTRLNWSSLLSLGDPAMLTSSSASPTQHNSSSSCLATSSTCSTGECLHHDHSSTSSSCSVVDVDRSNCDQMPACSSPASSWPLAPMAGSVLWRVCESTAAGDGPDQSSCLMQL